MVDLFGLDIAQIAADAISSAGNLQEGILTKKTLTRDPNDPTAEPGTETSTTHTFQGIRCLSSYPA